MLRSFHKRIQNQTDIVGRFLCSFIFYEYQTKSIFYSLFYYYIEYDLNALLFLTSIKYEKLFSPEKLEKGIFLNNKDIQTSFTKCNPYKPLENSQHTLPMTFLCINPVCYTFLRIAHVVNVEKCPSVYFLYKQI